MATAYDNWLESDCGIDDASEARAEAVSERAAQLTAERLTNEPRVIEAISDYSAEHYETLDAVLARFVISFAAAASNEAMAEAGKALRDVLAPAVVAFIRRDAETDAEDEQARLESDAPVRRRAAA